MSRYSAFLLALCLSLSACSTSTQFRLPKGTELLVKSTTLRFHDPAKMFSSVRALRETPSGPGDRARPMISA